MLFLNNERGFTFLEVMIAFSLIALVLVGVFQLQSQSIAIGARTRLNTIAPFLAKQKLADILSLPEKAESSEGDFGEDAAGYSWRVEISDTQSDYLQETGSRLKKIDLYIGFDDQEYHTTTYYFFDEE
jgi:general secretion pathway protein I